MDQNESTSWCYDQPMGRGNDRKANAIDADSETYRPEFEQNNGYKSFGWCHCCPWFWCCFSPKPYDWDKCRGHENDKRDKPQRKEEKSE